MSTHNIGFYEDLTRIISELSSNTHLISSSVLCYSFSLVLSLTKYLYLQTRTRSDKVSLVVRKLVFGVSDQVRHKPGPTTTQDG